MIGGTPKGFSNCELLVMNRKKQKQLQNPSLNRKGAETFDHGPAATPPWPLRGSHQCQERVRTFSSLTPAVVVIDEMTGAMSESSVLTPYSYRKATMGSTLVARRAGM